MFCFRCTNFLACHHLLTLDRAQAAGQAEKPYFHDPGLELSSSAAETGEVKSTQKTHVRFPDYTAK